MREINGNYQRFSFNYNNYHEIIHNIHHNYEENSINYKSQPI